MLFLLLWILIDMSTSYCAVTSDSDIVTHPNWPKNVQDDCGISYADRIIGGKNASLGQFPWLARIGYGSWVDFFLSNRFIFLYFETRVYLRCQHFLFIFLQRWCVEQNRIEYDCGGTLVTKYFVLTAAHCVTNLPPLVDVYWTQLVRRCASFCNFNLFFFLHWTASPSYSVKIMQTPKSTVTISMSVPTRYKNSDRRKSFSHRTTTIPPFGMTLLW